LKKIQLSKKAISSIAITSIVLTLIAGAAITGTLLALNFRANDVEYITYQEALDIASAIPEVATFIQENDIDSVTANRVDAVWKVEFFATGFNYTGDPYYWMNYAYVEINAINGEVIYYIVQSPQEPNLTEVQVLNTVLAIPEIGHWFIWNPDANPTLMYDGYELWYVNIYANYTLGYAMAIVSDLNNTVLWYELYDPANDAIHTEAEIITIVETLPEVQTWIVNNPTYDRYVSYRVIWEEINTTESKISKENLESSVLNATGGTWYVDYYSRTSADFIKVRVDDVTGEVISIDTVIVPQLTEAEAIAYASAVPDVADYLENKTIYISIEFNEYYGYWYIQFHNDIIYDEYAYVEVADPSGEILYYEIHDMPDPINTPQWAIDIVLAVEEVQLWIEVIENYTTHATFHDGKWFVDIVYIYVNGTGDFPSTIFAYEAIVDDLTGEILHLLGRELMLPCCSMEVKTA